MGIWRRRTSPDSLNSRTPQATQEVISRLPETTGEEFEAAVSAARDAFPAWRRTPVPTRARVMLKLQQLIRENMVRTAATLSVEDRRKATAGAGKFGLI